MHTQINLVSDDTPDVTTMLFGDRPAPWLSVDLRSGVTHLTLLIGRNAAAELANRLLDAVRELTPEVAPAEVAVVAPVCDQCGKPVESDGDTTSGEVSEWWTHVGGTYECSDPSETLIGGPLHFPRVNGSVRVHLTVVA